MAEVIGISESFYKIGNIERPAPIQDIDVNWKNFDTLDGAMNDQISIITADTRDLRDGEAANSYAEMLVIDKENFSGFIDRFGYNSESTSIRKLDKNHFTFITQVGSTQIVETFRSNEFEENYAAINNTHRVTVESIVVSSGEGQAVVLSHPYSVQGYFTEFLAQDMAPPHFTRDRGSGIEALSSYPLGGVSNSNSNQFAAMGFLHELRHAYQEDMTEYQSEIDASEYALQANAELNRKGIHLVPNATPVQSKKYLEKYLVGYARRHHPVKTVIHRTLDKLPGRSAK